MALTKDQQAAMVKIKEWKKSSDPNRRLFMLTGGAGVGKTFSANEAMKVGSKVPKKSIIGMTVGHLARLKLQESIPNSQTYASTIGLTMDFKADSDDVLEISFQKRDDFTPRDLSAIRFVVFDEAGMIGIEDINYILDVIPKTAKILLMGDKYQLPKVGAEGDEDSELFNIEGYELTEPVRQKEGDSILEMSNLVRIYIDEKTPLNKLLTLKKKDFRNGKGYIFTNRESSIKSLANNISKGNDAICVTFRNKTKDIINSDVRRILHGGDFENILPGDMIVATSQYNPKGFWKPMKGKCFFLQGTTPVFFNGERFRVESVKKAIIPKSKLISTWKAKEYLTNNSDFEVIQGIYRDDLYHGIKVFQLKLEGIDEKVFVLDEGDRVKYNKIANKLRKIAYINSNIGILNQFISKFASINYAYAATLYSIQGQTIDTVYVDMTDVQECSKLSNKRKLQSLYVAFSRAKTNLAIF